MSGGATRADVSLKVVLSMCFKACSLCFPDLLFYVAHLVSLPGACTILSGQVWDLLSAGGIENSSLRLTFLSVQGPAGRQVAPDGISCTIPV